MTVNGRRFDTSAHRASAARAGRARRARRRATSCGTPGWALTASGQDARRPLRTQSQRSASPRQPAHRAAGLALRPLAGSADSCCASRTSTRSARDRSTSRASSRTCARSASTGTAGPCASPSAPALYRDAFEELRAPGPGLSVLVHARGHPRRRRGAPRPAARRRLSRHLPAPRRRRARRAGAEAGRPPVAAAGRRRGERRLRRPAPRRGRAASRTTSCCCAGTARSPTTWPWSWTTRSRASARWCGATTCSSGPRASCCSRDCSGAPLPRMRTCRWCWAPDGKRLGQAPRRGHAGRPGRARREPAAEVVELDGGEPRACRARRAGRAGQLVERFDPRRCRASRRCWTSAEDNLLTWPTRSTRARR